jgi:membrane-bound ClpP family serine protease
MKAVICLIGMVMTIVGIVLPVVSSVTGYLMDTKGHAMIVVFVLFAGIVGGGLLIKKSNI